jgi:hypothetical protein
MAGALYLMVSRFLPLYKVDVGFLALAPKFTAIAVAGLAIFFIGAKLLRIHEAEVVLKRVLHPIRVLKRVGKNGS